MSDINFSLWFNSHNIIDWSILAIVVLSTIISVLRGFVSEFVSLATWILAFGVAIIYSEKLAAQFANFSTPAVRWYISFIVLFVGIMLLGSIFSWIVNSVKIGGPLSFLDRIFGILFGIARGLLVVIIAVALMHFGKFDTADMWKQSKLLPQINKLQVTLIDNIPTKWKETWDEFIKSKTTKTSPK